MRADRGLDSLTPREREVLALVRRGLTNEEIAERLDISLDGAKYHVSQILSKLGVSSREEAASLVEGRGVPWRRLAGAVVVAAALAGIGVLAWSVLVNEGRGEDTQRMLRPDATPSPSTTVSPTDPPRSTRLVELPPSDHPAFECPEFDTRDLESGVYVTDFAACSMRRLTDATSDRVHDWSPDGERLVFTRLDEPRRDVNSDVYVASADGDEMIRLTNTPEEREDSATWSPDGSWIAYVSLSLEQIMPDGSGLNDEEWIYDLNLIDPETLEVTTLINDSDGIREHSWSPNGEEIAVVEYERIVSVNVNSGDVRTLATNSAGRDAVWSPDGSMIAYTCTTPELIEREFTCVVPHAGGASRLVTGFAGPGPPTDGRLESGRFPQWSDDGRLVIRHDGQLYFVDPATAMPVGKIGALNADLPFWYDDGLVYGSRCLDMNIIPCPRESFLHDYGSGMTYRFAGNPGLIWSNDRLRASFAIGFYGVGIA